MWFLIYPNGETYKQTNRHADVLIAIRRSPTEVEVIGNDKIEVFIGGSRIF